MPDWTNGANNGRTTATLDYFFHLQAARDLPDDDRKPVECVWLLAHRLHDETKTRLLQRAFYVDCERVAFFYRLDLSDTAVNLPSHEKQ